MDMTDTIIPRSDQQNFEDYLTGPRTVTISGVSQGNAEQPVNIELAEYPGRPYKPNKTMRRVIVNAWGASTDIYVGRRLRLVGNPAVIFGGKAVGGVEVEAMSHIDKALTINLTTTRGKRKPFTVQPLATPAVRNWLHELDLTNADPDAIKALGSAARAAKADEKTMAAITDAYKAATNTEGNIA